MSSPAALAPSSPWLAPPFLLTILLLVANFCVTWGVVTTRLDAYERGRVEDRAELKSCTAAVATLQVRAAMVESEQVSTKRLIDTEIAGLRREMERMATALQRLTEASGPRSHR